MQFKQASTFSQLARLKRISFWLCCVGITLFYSPEYADCFVHKSKIDGLTAELISRLSWQPELMNIEYLQYYLGRPENEYNNVLHFNKCYYWYSAGCRMIKYELQLSEEMPGCITDAIFILHLNSSKLTFNDIESMYGVPTRRLFDQYSFPTEQYLVKAGTYVSFTQPHNIFEVNRIAIQYHGEPLPKPTPQDMYVAQKLRRYNAFAYYEKGEWNYALSLLQAHLVEFPFDLEAHYLLAKILKARGHINPAIAEYQFILANDTSSNLRDKCIDGLKDLRLKDEIIKDFMNLSEKNAFLPR